MNAALIAFEWRPGSTRVNMDTRAVTRKSGLQEEVIPEDWDNSGDI
ncbi:MAG: hypothetical protein M0017_12215 [Desulfobacteraceae bacterium]|nr:hypothetical protein [Desulfobacteraceae bacterium]